MELFTRMPRSSESQCFSTAKALRAMVVAAGGNKVEAASFPRRSANFCRKSLFLQETLEKALAKLLMSMLSKSFKLLSEKCLASSSKLSAPHLADLKNQQGRKQEDQHQVGMLQCIFGAKLNSDFNEPSLV